MTEHDRVRKDRAEEFKRTIFHSKEERMEALLNAIRGIQSTDDPSLLLLNEELDAMYIELRRSMDEDRRLGERLVPLVNAVCDRFPYDPSMPSVVLSRIPAGYYVSVVRYAERFGQGKWVVASATGTILAAVVEFLHRGFCDGEERDPALAGDGSGDRTDGEAVRGHAVADAGGDAGGAGGDDLQVG